MTSEIKISFNFEGFREELVANLKEKIGDVKNKLLIEGLDKQNKNIILLYNGNMITDDKKIEEIINQEDKKSGKMNLLLQESSFEPDSGLIKIIVQFEGQTINIHANLKDDFKAIKNKILNQLEIKDLETHALYKGNKINEDKKLEEIIDKLDKEERLMNILLCEADDMEDPDQKILDKVKKQSSGPNSEKIEIEFNFNGHTFSFQAELESIFKQIKNELLKKLDKKDLYFLYRGNILEDQDKKLKFIISPDDIKSRKMILLVQEY